MRKLKIAICGCDKPSMVERLHKLTLVDDIDIHYSGQRMSIKDRFKELLSNKYHDVSYFEATDPKTFTEMVTLHFSGFFEPKNTIDRSRFAGNVIIPPDDAFTFDMGSKLFNDVVNRLDKCLKKA